MEKILDKLEEYKDIIIENTEIYSKLCNIIREKENLNVNIELISRLDDIFEDIVTTNVNIKILKKLLENNLEINISNRESERYERIKKIKQNNQLATICFFLSLISE
jgi:hypothetical protein